MNTSWIIWLLPFVAALIGWLTNYIAVKMLFYPREPVKVLFVTFQGVFPKRQAQVAVKVGKMVAEQLLTSDDIQKRIQSSDNVEMIVEQIERKIDGYFETVLPEKYPIVSKLMSQKIQQRIKTEVLMEVESIAPAMISKQIDQLEDQLDIEEIITEKVKLLSPKKLEDLIWSILDKEFKFIEFIGAVIGFFIGLAQVALTLLAR